MTMFRPRRAVVSAVFIVIFFMAGVASAAMYINLVTLNSSGTETRQVPITYYLPKEIGPNDIIDAAGLQPEYDIDQTCYFLRGSITLAPKESRVIKIQVKDVWYITPDEVNTLKRQMDENLKLVADTAYHEIAQARRDQLVKQLDYVLSQQENFSGNVDRRIEEYRSHIEVLDQIRNTTFSIEYWEDKAIKVPEKFEKTVSFVIEVENPKDEKKTYKQQHYLPAEVKSEDVVNNEGFEVRYDEDKKLAYLYKEEELLPKEKKHYEITINDIWRIPKDKTDNLLDRSENAYQEVEDSEYASSAKYLYTTILGRLKAIEDSQKPKTNMKEHIGIYRTNKVLYAETELDVQRLERILALVRAKRLEELEKSRVKNVLKRIRSLDGVEKISEAIFGKKLSVDQTWRIIWRIVIFVGIFTALHFVTWLQRSREAKRKAEEEKAQAV